VSFTIFDFKSSNRFWIIHSKFKIGLGPPISHTRRPLACLCHTTGSPPGSPSIRQHNGCHVTFEFNVANPLWLPSLRGEAISFPSPLTLHAERVLTPLLCSPSSAGAAECHPEPPLVSGPEDQPLSRSTPQKRGGRGSLALGTATSRSFTAKVVGLGD
jgi:hypothetical protein